MGATIFSRASLRDAVACRRTRARFSNSHRAWNTDSARESCYNLRASARVTGATDGNLGAHIETLSKAGHVAVEKAFVAKRPRTTVVQTPAGRAAFAHHVALLRQIIDSAGGA
jgi:DNA-binding MarR family transcriptional regulator